MSLTITLPSETEARLREQSQATGKDISTLVREAVEGKLNGFDSVLPTFQRAVEEARYLLTLTDEDDKLMIAPNTWDRAIAFLQKCVRGAVESRGVAIDLPEILPGPVGSIDLHWKHPACEMLINIPADPKSPAQYYGDDSGGNSVKGTLSSGDNGGLLLWLTTRK